MKIKRAALAKGVRARTALAKYMNKKTIEDLPDIKNKRVFVTCDFNISLNDGKIANDTRIREIIPTLEYLLKKKCSIILASHLDRPNGYDLKYTLAPVSKKLESLLNQKIELVDNFWEDEALNKVKSANNIVLLENIRFFKGEKLNDPAFSAHLAKMADIFVNDAFGASHRTHASIVGIAKHLPAVAGLLLGREIEMLNKALISPKRPFVVFIGGAKTPEKISVIEKLLDIADTVCLGGAIANTFLAAWGFGMGKSLVDYEMVEMARNVFWKTTRKHSALLLPPDVIIADGNDKKNIKSVNFDKVPSNVSIYDIGPKTSRLYKTHVLNAKTIIWNGPMGLYENPLFKKGTDKLLNDVAASNAFKIIGGGDTLTILKDKKKANSFDHISTGGSAMLEFIKEGTLPGIDVLQNK